MRDSDHLAQQRQLAILLVVVVASATAATLWRPDGLGIWFGCGLICVVGIVTGMVATHYQRKFDREAMEMSGERRRDV